MELDENLENNILNMLITSNTFNILNIIMNSERKKNKSEFKNNIRYVRLLSKIVLKILEFLK